MKLFNFVTFDHIASKQISRLLFMYLMIYVKCELLSQGASINGPIRKLADCFDVISPREEKS